MSEIPASFVDTWRKALKARRHEQLDAFPNYHVADPGILVTSCQPRSIRVGSGESIFTQELLPAIQSASHEIILVTCFWARSPTLTALGTTLSELAQARRAAFEREGEHGNGNLAPPLKIRICFSSRSLFQKILHTWSKDGHTYPASGWPALGLPDETLVRAANIDMRVKSLFFLPFSVMHPKFLIVDRQRAWMPSCNVSWETWFEGCLEISGQAVGSLLTFYDNVWERPRTAAGRDSLGRGEDNILTSLRREPELPTPATLDSDARGYHGPASAYRVVRFDGATTYPAIVLPSSHHQNPRFRIPFLRQTPPPPTPLNIALSTLFEVAQREIHIITPNLTCAAVVSMLVAALRRGIHVKIWTSRSMMLMEQLLTAATTTEWVVKSLVRQYRQMCEAHSGRTRKSHRRWRRLPDLEAAPTKPGHLEIMYYAPHARTMDETLPEPVFSHFKMTLVDGQYLVLGSGNMDRASWYTSQELGILLFAPGFEHAIWTEALESRLVVRYRGHGVDELAGQNNERQSREGAALAA